MLNRCTAMPRVTISWSKYFELWKPFTTRTSCTEISKYTCTLAPRILISPQFKTVANFFILAKKYFPQFYENESSGSEDWRLRFESTLSRNEPISTPNPHDPSPRCPLILTPRRRPWPPQSFTVLHVWRRDYYVCSSWTADRLSLRWKGILQPHYY